MPELLAVLCLLGLLVTGGLGVKWLREDLKASATIRRRLREG
jgi:hypothetical protein